MRNILILLFAAQCAMAWPGGYATFLTITVNPGQVAGTLTDYPLFFAGDARLKGSGAGGCATSAAGYDIVFASDAAGNSLLKFELTSGSYNSATGSGEWWIRVPALAAGTSIYAACGNPGVTTYQGDPSGGAWNSSAAGAWHLSSGASLSGADSTANANHGTVRGGSAAAGMAGGGIATTNAAQGITVPSAASLQPANLTAATWLNRSAGAQVSFGKILAKGTDQNGAPYGSYAISFNGSDPSSVCFGLGFTDTSLTSACTPSGTIAANTWYYVAGTYNGSTAVVYVNGVQQGSVAVAKTITYAGACCSGYYLTFGADLAGASPGTLNAYGFNGSLDEPRLWNAALSPAWIAADYNNQSAPAAFYSLGLLGTGAIRHRVVSQ